MSGNKEQKAIQKYFVVLKNDDHNTLDNVVLALHKYAGLHLVQALLIASAVHVEGAAAIGIWHHEVAETIMSRLNEAGLTAVLALKE